MEKVGAPGISRERFPYSGHFYAIMGLTLFGEEMGAAKKAEVYAEAALKDLGSWQAEDGSFPLKGWMSGKGGDEAYATAFAALVYGVPAKRLSIFHRRPEKLKRDEASENT